MTLRVYSGYTVCCPDPSVGLTLSYPLLPGEWPADSQWTPSPGTARKGTCSPMAACSQWLLESGAQRPAPSSGQRPIPGIKLFQGSAETFVANASQSKSSVFSDGCWLFPASLTLLISAPESSPPLTSCMQISTSELVSVKLILQQSPSTTTGRIW